MLARNNSCHKKERETKKLNQWQNPFCKRNSFVCFPEKLWGTKTKSYCKQTVSQSIKHLLWWGPVSFNASYYTGKVVSSVSGLDIEEKKRGVGFRRSVLWLLHNFAFLILNASARKFNNAKLYFFLHLQLHNQHKNFVQGNILSQNLRWGILYFVRIGALKCDSSECVEWQNCTSMHLNYAHKTTL